MYSYRRAGSKRRRNGHDGSPAPSSSHTRAQVRQALSGHIQAKLTVGAPNDAYEQEADRVASQVMNTSDGALNAGHTGGQLQRQCTECGEENDGAMVQTLQRQSAEEEEEAQPKLKQGEIRRQADEEDKEEEAVQAKSKTDPAHSSLNTTTAEQINSQRGRGVPLAQSERNFFEPRFGHDFSSVRIHTGADAAQSAEAIQAKAFTLGRDLFFNSGEYAPGTDTGRRLMAHELTHVIQQQGRGEHTPAVRRKVQVEPGVKLDTMGYTTSKSGDTYTCPRIVKKSIWNEIFTALFNSARVFKLKGTTAKKAKKNLLAHMAARRNVIRFASKKKYDFNVNEKRNPTYWKTGVTTSWELTTPPSGTSVEKWRKKAYADINLHPGQYEMACNQATVVTLVGGAGAPYNNNVAGSDSDWIPGESGYIENTGYVSGVSPAGTEGENIIYTGKDKFWGHLQKANTYHTLQQWFNTVKSWNGSAKIDSDRFYPSNGMK